MKKFLIILFILSLTVFVVGDCTIYISYPTSTPEGPFPTSDPEIIPCLPLTFSLNAYDLKQITDSSQNPINELTIKLEFYFNGSPAYLGYTLASSNNPLPLVVCESPIELQGINPQDVFISSWKAEDYKIEIKLTNIQNWNPNRDETIQFTIFVGDGVLPDSNCFYNNFPSSTFQVSTLLSICNLLSTSNTADLVLKASSGSSNVHFKVNNTNSSEVKLYTFRKDLNSNVDSTEMVCVGRKFSKIISADIGTKTNTKSPYYDTGVSETKDFISIDEKNLNFFFGEDTSNTYSSIILPYTPTDVMVSDVNGDGRNDLIVLGDDGSINIYDVNDLDFHKGDTLFLTKIFEVKVNNVFSNGILVDINSNGKYDYVLLDKNLAQAEIFYDGDFTNPTTFYLDGTPEDIVSGDFNGDGYLDICIAKSTGKNVSLLYNNGDGTFSLDEETLDNGANVPFIGLDKGDFNRDGFTDVAFLNDTVKRIVIDTGSVSGLTYKNLWGSSYTPSSISVENFDGLNGDDIMVAFSDFHNLMLMTSDEDGNLNLSSIIDTLSDVSLGDSGQTVLEEDGIVAIVLGTTYGGYNDRNGLVGIVKGNFNVLYFPKSNDISFSLINHSQDSKMISNFELYTEIGTLLKYKNVSVNENSQFARYFISDEIFGDGLPDNTYVRAFISSPNPYGMYLFNSPSNPRYLDGGKNLSVYDIKTEGYFPIIETGGKSTTLYLINPFKDENSITLFLYDVNGNLVSEKSYIFSSREAKKLEVSNIFGNVSDEDYVKVFSDKGFIGVEAFGDFSETLATVDALSEVWDTVNLYCPHVAWGNFGNNYYSKLSLVNISDKDVTLNFYLYDDDGNLVKEVDSVGFKKHSKLLLNLKEFFGLDETTTGYLKISTNSYVDGFKMVGAITFGDADSDSFMATLPLESVPGNFLLGHIANGTIGSITYWTGLAILSPFSDSDVTITCYSQDGVQLATTNLHLDRGCRYVRVLNDIFPQLGDVMGGYIEVTTDNGYDLFVFQLFGDKDLTFLSAVPAVMLGE